MPAVSFQAIYKTFATPKGPFQALNQVNLDIESYLKQERNLKLGSGRCSETL